MSSSGGVNLERCKGEGEHTATAKSSQFLAGITLAVLSSVFFATTSIIVKCIVNVSRSQLALFRYIGIFLMSLPLVMQTGDSWLGPSSWSFRLWMCLRGLFGGASLLFKFHALEHISLANTTVITLSTPIFVFLFARILLGESFGRYHAISLALSAIGIALASKVHTLLFLASTDHEPTVASLNLTANSSSPNLLNLSESSYHILLGNVYALLSTILGAMVFVFIRKMSTVHHSVILFNFSWIAMVELTPISYLSGEYSLPTEHYTPYLIFVLACLSFYGQIFVTKAIQMEEAGVVSVVRGSSEVHCSPPSSSSYPILKSLPLSPFLQAIFSFIGEIAIFGVQPDLYSITGAILVLTSVLLLTFRKYITNLSADSWLKGRFNFLTH